MNTTIGLTPNGGGVIPLAAGNTGLYQGTGKVLHIRATGTAGSDEDGATLTLTLYQVPASVVAAGLSATSFTNWNKIAQSSALTINGQFNQASSWSFDARVQLGLVGSLVGEFTDAIDGGTVDAWQATNTVFVGGQGGSGNYPGPYGEQDLNFVMVATAGSASLGQVVMTEFAINLED
ncbi:MAG: hypothetical protein WCB00_24290 [Candidatus Acidiferrales bacterium]